MGLYPSRSQEQPHFSDAMGLSNGHDGFTSRTAYSASEDSLKVALSLIPVS